MFDVLAITKALADENRLRALCALGGRELCVCEIIEMLGLAPSTVSKHMSILRQARLIEGRKQGRWMYYRLAGRDASAAVRNALKWVGQSLKDDAQVAKDKKVIDRLVRTREQRTCNK